MIALEVMAFIVAVNMIPLALMWGTGAFVSQRQPSQMVGKLIKFFISASLFGFHVVGALFAYKHYRAEWWNSPLAAIILGVGISAIIAVSTYSGEKD